MNYGDISLFLSAATLIVSYLILQEFKANNKKECCMGEKSVKDLIDRLDKVLGADKVT